MTNGLEKEWENRLGQAINLANTIRQPGMPTDMTYYADEPLVRRRVEQMAGTGQRSEATWRMAIKIAKEVK